jgi:hypothetical protein
MLIWINAVWGRTPKITPTEPSLERILRKLQIQPLQKDFQNEEDCERCIAETAHV